MARFDKYFLNQLLVAFGFFSLILVAVFWVNKAVLLFDELISDGHSAKIFFEFSFLGLPSAVAIVFPISSFAAAIYVSNRLNNESELTIMSVNGLGPWRLARPVLIFGILIALFLSIVTHFLMPKSQARLKHREYEITANISGKLLKEGNFIHPQKSITIFVEKITGNGELKNVFLSDRRSVKSTKTVTSEAAYLINQGETKTLVLLKGVVQNYNKVNKTLSTTLFDDLSYDVSDLFKQQKPFARSIKGISTMELLFQNTLVSDETGHTSARILEEAHKRFQQPLLCIITALIGFAAILSAGYSRFGSGKQIIFAIFILVLIKLTEGAITDVVRRSSKNWPLSYVPLVFGLLWVMVLISASNKHRWVSKFLKVNALREF